MRAVICSKFGSPEDLEVKEVGNQLPAPIR